MNRSVLVSVVVLGLGLLLSAGTAVIVIVV
jgi:hypothetical protein